MAIITLLDGYNSSLEYNTKTKTMSAIFKPDYGFSSMVLDMYEGKDFRKAFEYYSKSEKTGKFVDNL